jgi:two-component system nitrogen regulation sensor histidine kinase NtrY
MVDPNEKGKRKKEFYVIFVLSGVIGMLLFLQTYFRESLLWSKNAFFFTMLNLNIVLLLLVLFLLIRNFAKLILEYRKGLLGSKLRTKLTFSFLVLSLLPSVVLFGVSALFISQNIKSWFSSQIERSLEVALEATKIHYAHLLNQSLNWSKRVAQGMPLEEALSDGSLSWVGLYDENARLLSSVSSEDLPFSISPPKEMVKEALMKKEVTKILPFRGGEIIWGGYKGEGQVGFCAYYLPHGLSGKLESISQAYFEYRRSEAMKGPITLNYLLLLLLISLLVAFWSVWLGFKIAKDITDPLGELLVATKKVAEGQLEIQLQASPKNEMGILMEAFNKMTQDLKRTQKALEERRRYTEVVLENVSTGVISFDRNGRITTLNEKAKEILGIQDQRVIGRYYRQVLSPDLLKVARELFREMNKSESKRLEKQMEIPINGRPMILKVTLNVMKDPDGNYVGMVVTLDDLTQLAKMQRVEAWKEVASRIAHEIKNPLTPIQLAAERIWRRYKEKLAEDKEIFEECIRTIISQVKELKRMVNEFGQFARMPLLVLRVDDLNSIVKESVSFYQQAHPEVTFKAVCDPKLPHFKLDREAMKRVLMNLLDNAIEALNGSGIVEVHTRYDPLLEIATLEVRDNGCGVPDELKGRLFEPHFSTKGEGRGLGLAIVSAIVADHEGFIRVKDNEPKGTRFIIELPVRR